MRQIGVEIARVLGGLEGREDVMFFLAHVLYAPRRWDKAACIGRARGSTRVRPSRSIRPVFGQYWQDLVAMTCQYNVVEILFIDPFALAINPGYAHWSFRIGGRS